MDISAITTMIGSLGFPIFMSVLLFNQMIKQNDMHAEQMDKLKESINNNTIALNNLVIQISKEDK